MRHLAYVGGRPAGRTFLREPGGVRRAKERITMNQDTLVTLGRSLFDAMTAHDLSTWEAVLATDFVADYPSAPGLGRAQARAYNAPFVAAFPDLRMEVERVFVQ